MQDAIYLDAKMVPAQLRGNYKGKMFRVIVCDHMTVPSDAGLWSGGSRDTYTFISLDSGQSVTFPFHNEAPWSDVRRDRPIPIAPGFAVVQHTIFCGKDLGLRFYLHPDNAAKLLPAPIELTAHETIVLAATAGLKSSYNGMDRYEMKRNDWSYSWRNNPPFMSRAEWDMAKALLIGKGLLNKAGAITVQGRNANKQ